MHVNRDLTLGSTRIFLENIKKVVKLKEKRECQDESKIFLLGSIKLFKTIRIILQNTAVN